MLNLKNTSKLFLAAIVLTATVSFSCPAFASCDNPKNEYEKMICAQQKTLAAKNADSNKDAADKAVDAKAKAAKKATDTKAKAVETAKKATESVGAAAGNTRAAADGAQNRAQMMQDAGKGAVTAKADAQKRMTEALRNGDMDAANKAKADMAAADKAIDDYKDLAKDAKKDAKKAEKADKKVNKAVAKAEAAEKKAEEKAFKADVKAAKKQEKTAEKDLKKADKEVEKLQKKCEKNPEKCDTAALQAAMAKQDAAKALAEDAQKNREKVDGTTAEREAAEEEARRQAAAEAAATMEEEGPEEAEIVCSDPKDPSTCKEVSTSEKLDSKGNPVSKQRCEEAKGKIFNFIACKAMTTLADIRVIVYTLAGFGLIAFAFAAIFNKISWKHLAHLCIALFILSMMTPFIEYFTHDDGGKLTYGDYLPAGFTNINGSDADQQPCDVKKGDVCPDVTVDTSAKNSKWSWKDLKNTVKSGINAAKTAYNTYQTAKTTVETAVSQAKKIGTAIKNSEGGLTGILDTVGEVTTASDAIFNTAKVGAGAILANTKSIATDVQNAGKSGDELKFDKENQTRIAELEKKMKAGNLSPQQMEYAKAELQQRQAAVDKNKVVDFANTTGAKAVDKLNKVAKTAGTVSKVATAASSAADQGAKIGGGIGTTGGDIVGSIFGVATALGEGTGAVQDSKQAKIDAANAAAKKKADAEAAAKKKAATQANNKALSQGKQWDTSFNATMDNKAPAANKPAGDAGKSNGDSASSNTSTNTNTANNKPKTTAPSQGSSSSKTASLPKDTVTVTKTTTWGGNGQSVGENSSISLGGGSRTETVTVDNAKKNKDGSMTVGDDKGNYATYDKDGNLTGVVNYVTGKEVKFDKNGKEIKNGQTPGWQPNTPGWGGK